MRENATVNLYENEEIRRRRHWALSREAPKGVAADGVIAFDLDFVQALVAALEPLRMAGYQAPLTGANVITAMRKIWARPADSEETVTSTGGGSSDDWWLHRKDFMGDLMRAALDKNEIKAAINELVDEAGKVLALRAYWALDELRFE